MLTIITTLYAWIPAIWLAQGHMIYYIVPNNLSLKFLTNSSASYSKKVQPMAAQPFESSWNKVTDLQLGEIS